MEVAVVVPAMGLGVGLSVLLAMVMMDQVSHREGVSWPIEGGGMMVGLAMGDGHG